VEGGGRRRGEGGEGRREEKGGGGGGGGLNGLVGWETILSRQENRKQWQ